MILLQAAYDSQKERKKSGSLLMCYSLGSQYEHCLNIKFAHKEIFGIKSKSDTILK
jgi:hypothetical protein